MRVRVNVRVIYGDTDAMGIVYHGNYLRWFEVGRTELFRTLGIVYRDLEARGYYLPLTKAYCHYHAPARYDDILVIETSIAEWGRASIRFDYVVWDEGGAKRLVEGYTHHAFTNAGGRVVRAPMEIIALIRDACEPSKDREEEKER